MSTIKQFNRTAIKKKIKTKILNKKIIKVFIHFFTIFTLDFP